MTLEIMLILLGILNLVILAGYFAVMQLWKQEENQTEYWEIGARIRTPLDPHRFLPGIWESRVHFTDGSTEYERVL